jgi:hypothetical protein
MLCGSSRHRTPGDVAHRCGGRPPKISTCRLLKSARLALLAETVRRELVSPTVSRYLALTTFAAAGGGETSVKRRRVQSVADHDSAAHRLRLGDAGNYVAEVLRWPLGSHEPVQGQLGPNRGSNLLAGLAAPPKAGACSKRRFAPWVAAEIRVRIKGRGSGALLMSPTLRARRRGGYCQPQHIGASWRWPRSPNDRCVPCFEERPAGDARR